MTVEWIQSLVRRLRDRSTWYEAPADFEAGVDAFAASLEAHVRDHPSSAPDPQGHGLGEGFEADEGGDVVSI